MLGVLPACDHTLARNCRCMQATDAGVGGPTVPGRRPCLEAEMCDSPTKDRTPVTTVLHGCCFTDLAQESLD